MPKYRFEEIAVNSTAKKKPVEEDKYTYLGLEHLDPGTLRVSRFGSEVAPIGEKLIMKKGDVLFGKRRAYQKKVAIAPFDGIFSAHGMVLRPKTNVIDPRFFPLFISSDYFLEAAIAISVGSLSPTINWKDLKDLEFELPNQDTQRKLAEILWSIQDTIESYKELVSITDDLAKTHFIEQINNLKATGKGKEYKLGDLTKIRTGKLDANANDPEGEYPFFTCSRDALRINSYSYDCECVLVAGNGELNVKYYEGKFDAYQRTYIVESIDKSIIKVPFIYRFLSIYVETLQNQAIGGVIKYIKLENLTDAIITVPSLEDQNEIVYFYERCVESKNSLINAIDELNSLYKKIISKHLFNKED